MRIADVALDGTKIKANASKHKAMSYERMEKRATELEAEVATWFGAAEAADAEEDKLHGRDQTGEEMPDWVADKKRRAEKIRNAKAELEAEAKAAAEAKLKAEAEAAEKREAEGCRKPGPKAAPPSTEPDAKAQKNFTDPDSRIMKSKDGFVQAYNAQAAVDGEAQIIVAHDVTQSAGDCGQLIPMTDAIEINLGRTGEPQHRCLCGDRPGQRRRCRPGHRRGHRRAALAGTGWRTDARRGNAREDQGWRAREPLPAAQAAARAGVRTDQTGPRFPPVPAARLRKSARRVGHRLHRPQPPQAGPEEESVRNVADGRLSRLTGVLPRRQNNETVSLT